MLNSTIVANINGGISSSQKVSSGLCSSLLKPVEFDMTSIKSNLPSRNEERKFIQKTNGKGSANIILNGQKKNLLDQNKNPQAKQFRTMNGNKNSVENTEENVPTPKIILYTERINSDWDHNYKIGAGLQNLGNTCFMNTVLQCLTYCPPLANYLLNNSDHTKYCKLVGFCMMCELQRHVKRALESSGCVLKPIQIYQKLKSIAKHFQFGRQEDAHEFLRYVIEHLAKSCVLNYNGYAKLDAVSKETTVINQIFGGYLQSQVTCLHCNEKSNSYDHFMDLILDIKQDVMTLTKALEKFVQPELLQNENAFKCPNCKAKVSANKKFTIHRPPLVATFQFKRFDFNRLSGGKITKRIQYPENLNLRPYMSISKGAPVTYRLNSVLIHLGTTCNSGHYYCYVRNSNGFWYVMDDNRVQQVTLNQVLNQTAYVLLYVRVNSAEVAHSKRPDHASNLKANHFLKNGLLSSSNCSASIPQQSLKQTNILPKIPKLPVPQSPSDVHHENPLQQKQILQPLSQNREKVAFNVCSPNANKLSQSLPRQQSPAPVKIESRMPTGILNGNHLVPYIEDSSTSSEEEDEDSKNKNVENNLNNSSSSGFLSTCSNGRLSGMNSSHSITDSGQGNGISPSKCPPVNTVGCASSPFAKQPCSANRPSYTVPSSSRTFHCNTTLNKKLPTTGSPSTNQIIFVNLPTPKNSENEKPPTFDLNHSFESSASVCSAKVNATSSQWAVKEVHGRSPSICSNSSTNSINSTTDWSVADQDSCSRKKTDRNSHSWSSQPPKCIEKLPTKDEVGKEGTTSKKVEGFTLITLSVGPSAGSSTPLCNKDSAEHCCPSKKPSGLQTLTPPTTPSSLKKSCCTKTNCSPDNSSTLDKDKKNERLRTESEDLPFRAKTDAFRDQPFLAGRPFHVPQEGNNSIRSSKSKSETPHKRTFSDAFENDRKQRSTRFSDSDEDCPSALPKKSKNEQISDKTKKDQTMNKQALPGQRIEDRATKHSRVADTSKYWKGSDSNLKSQQKLNDNQMLCLLEERNGSGKRAAELSPTKCHNGKQAHGESSSNFNSSPSKYGTSSYKRTSQSSHNNSDSKVSSHNAPSDSDSIRSPVGSADSSPEYEWVEKTKSSPHQTSKVDSPKYKSSHGGHHKQDLSEIQKKNCLFGSNVGTWNRKEREDNSLNEKHRKYYFSEIDEELDSGKTHRRKHHNFDDYGYKKNPFEEYQNKNRRENVYHEKWRSNFPNHANRSRGRHFHSYDRSRPHFRKNYRGGKYSGFRHQ